MTPDDIREQNLEWQRFARVLRADPQYAAWLDARSARARRLLGLPVLATPQEVVETQWEDERAERACERPAAWGVMD